MSRYLEEGKLSAISEKGLVPGERYEGEKPTGEIRRTPEGEPEASQVTQKYMASGIERLHRLMSQEGSLKAAMQWLRDMDLADMVTETYNASSMKALVRRLIEQGVEIPEFMNVTPFIRASIVKA